MKPAPRKIDKAYLAMVRELPCCVCQSEYQVQAHHAGKSATGRKADDDTAIPLCHLHHMQWHGAFGPVFCGWTRDQRRDWAAAKIAETRKLLGAGA